MDLYPYFIIFIIISVLYKIQYTYYDKFTKKIFVYPLQLKPSKYIADCYRVYTALEKEGKINHNYKQNAVHACQVTGNGKKASIIRECLQKKIISETSNFPMSSRRLHEIHQECFKKAECKGKPATKLAWYIVNNIPTNTIFGEENARILINESINRLGSCKKNSIFNTTFE